MESDVPNPNRVLFLVDVDDVEHLDTSARTEYWDIVPTVVDFNRLHESIDEIGRLAAEHSVDLLLYSQNDQVAKRANIGPVHKRLQLGYSSISPIDRGRSIDRVSQMKLLYKDFLHRGGTLRAVPQRETAGTFPGHATGTFSLALDTEQLGGVRYGLPRILDLLSKWNVKATFFVTNLVNQVYSNLSRTLSNHGHEVAPHGLCHEDLTPLDLAEQTGQIRAMIELLGSNPAGANFIGRMNDDTISALIGLGVRYFVYFDTNYYRLISYPKRSTRPTLIQHDGGEIWAFPVSVETYGLPWFSIKNMLDTAIMQSQRCGFPHVSVLGHPFRDGSIVNLDTTERLVVRLFEKGMRPITFAQLADTAGETGCIEADCSDLQRFFSSPRPAVSVPSTSRDWVGFAPQTAMSVLRRLTRRSLF